MSEKETIALVSSTINAVGPMTEYIRKTAPEVKVVN